MQTLKRKFTKLPSKIILLAGFLSLLVFTVSAPVLAADPCHDPSATAAELAGKKCCDKKNPTATTLESCLKVNPIIKDIRTVVNFLSAGVGIVITGSVIFGGIQYSMAGNNPNEVSAAKKRIQDTLIALLAFFFIFAFLQWIIPGGLLSGII